MSIEFSDLDPAGPILGGEEIVIMQGGMPVRATLASLSDNALLEQLVDMTNPYPVTGATALSTAQIGAWVTVTGTGADFLVNLPPVTIADAGAQVLLSVSPGTTATIAVQSAPASGLSVQGQPIQYLIFNESALFVYDGTQWTMPMLRRTPIAAELINSAALTLTAGSWVWSPLVAGAQMMDTNYQKWLSTDRFVAPRDGIYQCEIQMWGTGFTGAPGQVDVGLLIGTGTPSGAPSNQFFVRRNVTADTFQSLNFARSVRVAAGSYVVPTFRPNSPLSAGSIVAAATLTSRFCVTEILAR